MPVPAHGKSSLQTPDPYHVPGYLGYCAQEKYRIGDTFAHSTHKLLTDRSVASSSKLVLSHLYPEQASEWKELELQRKTLVDKRTQSWGDQKLKDPMIPRYTGFLPKGEHYHGKRYRETACNAISDFERDQLKHRKHTQSMRQPTVLQAGQARSPKHKTPLQPIRSDMAPYVSRSQFRALPSVYSMSQQNPDKHRKSGYTGFVPRSRNLLGSGFPVISHEALNNFGEDSWRQKNVQSAPVKVEKEKTMKMKGKPIYPVNSGMVPHYTGHVTGEQFRFGRTFGSSTENSLQLPMSMSRHSLASH